MEFKLRCCCDSDKELTRVFLGASVEVRERMIGPETLEALACWEGISLANDLQ